MEAFTLDSTEIIVLATAGGLFLIQMIHVVKVWQLQKHGQPQLVVTVRAY